MPPPLAPPWLVSMSLEAELPLRIVAVSALHQGANDYAFVRAFRRAGHSVRGVSQAESLPDWRGRRMKLARKALQNYIVRDFNRRLLDEARAHRAELLFVFKGSMVAASTLREVRRRGCIAIQFYPDVSFRTHGAELPAALREYDWVFTTKTFGLKDMREQLGVVDASFLPHGYDPETHRPVDMSRDDGAFFDTDVTFIGNWSPKKQKLLESVVNALSGVHVSVWGPPVWSEKMPEVFRGQEVRGLE